MADGTPRFDLPFILPGQAQKELYHNEALARVDALLHAAIEGPALVHPSPQPEEGQCWLVAAGAEAAWSGKDHQLAAWTSGGWRFIVPNEGMCVWNKATGYWVHWNGTSWSSGELPVARIQVGGQQVVAGRQPPILNPSGGTTIDAQARAAIAQVIATLMSHGLIG
ncbi:MAG TPA: DUF2793 domain-containing protein [Allosphingosinicella sp.]|jgi:hypothetical protein